jgi:hypothetical protein
MLADARWNYRMAVPPEVKDLVGKLAGPAFTWIEARGCQIDLYAHGKERLTEEPCKYVYRAEELLQGFEQSGWMPLPPAPPP